jgi:3-oxoacyl-[acyl-carrier protein] reductase
VTVAADLSGRTVLVTGAARGVGLALAYRFREAGATVVGADREAAELERAARLIGMEPVVADESKADEARAAVDSALAGTGRIDVLVNNAGIPRDERHWKLPDEDWDVLLQAHVAAARRYTAACEQHFLAQAAGRVVNVSSELDAQIVEFTQDAVQRLAPWGVAVHTIVPDPDRPEVTWPADLAELAVLVASGRAAQPNGAVVPVDGAVTV